MGGDAFGEPFRLQGARDVRMVEQALRRHMAGEQRFPIRSEIKRAMELELARIITTSNSPRTKLSAMRVAALFEQLNMEQEKRDFEQKPHEVGNVAEQVRLMDQVTAPGAGECS